MNSPQFAPAVALDGSEALRIAREFEASPKARADAATAARHACVERAAEATPLPGPLREVFADTRPMVFHLQLKPITARHLSILQQIVSPVFRQILDAGRIAREETPEDKAKMLELLNTPMASIDDIAECLFVFTQPDPLTMVATLQKIGGRAILRREALAAILDDPKFPPLADWAPVTELLSLHYSRCFSASLKHDRIPIPGEDEGNFTQPAGPATALAGSGS